MDYQRILCDITAEIQPFAEIGKQADYIPALAEVNPNQFGICIEPLDGSSPCSLLKGTLSRHRFAASLLILASG